MDKIVTKIAALSNRKNDFERRKFFATDLDSLLFHLLLIILSLDLLTCLTFKTCAPHSIYFISKGRD